ncbi:hypothetical protein EK904_014545, partial [Melospiza melodia maxima]
DDDVSYEARACYGQCGRARGQTSLCREKKKNYVEITLAARVFEKP